MTASESYHVPERILGRRPRMAAAFFADTEAAPPEPHPDDVGEGDGGWPGIGRLIEEKAADA